MIEVSAKICRPTVRGHVSGEWDRRAGAGPWSYSMKCFEHDVGWATAGRLTWRDALNVAADHQQEWAEFVPRQADVP